MIAKCLNLFNLFLVGRRLFCIGLSQRLENHLRNLTRIIGSTLLGQRLDFKKNSVLAVRKFSLMRRSASQFYKFLSKLAVKNAFKLVVLTSCVYLVNKDLSKKLLDGEKNH
jgi:hypothetical protein